MDGLESAGVGSVAVRQHGLTWPTPFSGIGYSIELDSPEDLAAFLQWTATGCGGGVESDAGEGNYHMHNFAVDTSRNAVFGSSLMMECVLRWRAEVRGAQNPA